VLLQPAHHSKVNSSEISNIHGSGIEHNSIGPIFLHTLLTQEPYQVGSSCCITAVITVPNSIISPSITIDPV
jgi:hypothetical protein